MTKIQNQSQPLTSVGLGVIGTQSSTMNFIDSLMRGGYRVNYLISLPPKLSNPVADYQNLKKFAADRGISFIWVNSYEMKDEQTKKHLVNIPLKIVFVVGWQRLVPAWFLKKIPYGVYGMHGSSRPLPKGRGRSPLNWSIIEGKDRFYTYLFRYDADVDSGDIIDYQRFDICAWDTIQSLQHKNTVSQYKLTLKNLPAILEGTATPQQQNPQIAPSYYPKRTHEDGAIDWENWSARDIYALIRAVTHPYPGAFTEYEKKNIYIWRAAPFDSCIQYEEAKPGEIVEVLSDKTFVVKCFIDTLLILEYEAPEGWSPIVGRYFSSQKNISWIKLAEMTMEEIKRKPE